MRYLLNAVYVLLLIAASPWLLAQAIRKGKYREGFAAKFFGLVPRREGSETCLWFHAVSVGEVNLLRPLLDEIRKRRPRWRCVVSTTTMTGMALARKRYPGCSVFYCPLDFSWAVAAAMRRIRPDVLVLAELELWPNLVAAARQSGAKVALVNGRLSENSARGYARIRPLVRRILRRIDLLAVQDENYAARFRSLGADEGSLKVTGSMKYDGAETDRANASTGRLKDLWAIAPADCVFLAGSTQEPEESIALDTWLELVSSHPELRLILVPRHPDRFEAVAEMLRSRGVRWQRRTELDSDSADRRAPVLLVDVIGELGAWWGTAEIAYVGGSMGPRGGQNMIEPAAYGAAVSFGPNTRNFRDIVAAMLARDAAIVVRDGRELTVFVRRCLDDPNFRRQLGGRAQQLVREQLGATGRTFSLLESLVEQTAPGTAVPPKGLARPVRQAAG
ncbi:MAG: 3-deoxy-D-manno-octulosonic acid transferase [Thermoguttaceae bacterium]